MGLRASLVCQLVFAFVLAVVFSPISFAQTAASGNSRITQALRENDRIALKGNTHPLASAKNDAGAAPDSLPMERMLLVLRRSPEQESALKALMESQQSKSSTNFHQWLTPEQFGQQFGVSDGDVQAVSTWLQAHGFQVNRVATSKMLIEFSGTAGQVRDAFQTQIHKYVVNGEAHWANASDPTIPAALAPVVAGVNTLHNFRKKPMVQKRGLFSRSAETGAVTPLDNVGCNGVSNGVPTCLGVGPADFNAIYHVPATVGGSAPGTGQTIAVVGDSNICTGSPLPAGCTTDDIVNFRTIFGLPLGAANNLPKIILDGPDPGLNGDEIEADLDVEYSGAIAPNAQILFVIGENTESSAGIDLAAERIVDGNLAPVLSESFGECEAALGNAGNSFYATLFEQAAAQGISVFISSGDGGSGNCDQFQSVASSGLTVNGIASTPFTVAVGGTDFDFQAAGYPGNFWNPANGPNGVSAKGYIPETTWNDSCAQSPSGQTNGCNGLLLNSNSNLLQVAGGGGGQSNCVQQSFLFGCTASYAKPTWQSGSSVPNDSVRDIPDVSLFSSDGQASGSFYIICASDLGGTCASGGPSFSFIGVGGTSAATPAFAAIMSLVNQNMVSGGHSGRQGNPNFVLYPLSAAQTEANCNSSTGPAANCVFNDVVKGNNSVPCVAASFNCSITTAGSASVGVLETVNSSGVPTGTIGFATATGFDLATGLGSINVTNLVNGWPAAVGAFVPTTTTLSLSPALPACPPGTPAGITSCISVVHGATVTVNINVSGGTALSPITATTNTANDASLIGTCQTATPNCFVGGSNTAGVDRFDAIGGNADIYQLTNGAVTGTTTGLVGGTYNVFAHYAGDGVHGASDSVTPIQVNVTPEGSKTTVSVLQVNPFNGVTIPVTTAPYGSILLVRTDINGASSGLETATGQVTLTDSFAGSIPVSLSLNSDGNTEFQTPSANFPGNNPTVITIPVLATGAHSFTSVYAGDASYTTSTSAAAALTVTKAASVSTITTFPPTTAPNANFTLTATVDTQSAGNTPSGTVTFFAGATSLGTAPVSATNDGSGFAAAQATLTTAHIASTSAITAQYAGDTNYTNSTSAAVTVSVVTPSFTITPASNPSIVAGASGTSVITVAPTGGFTGSVALTCSVAPSNLTSTPTCSFNTTPVVLGVAQTSTLTVATTVTTALTTYTVTVTGTSGATVVSAPVMVTVTTPGSFALTSTAVTIAAPGQTGTSTITATGSGGFTGSVALTCSVAPSGAAVPPTCSVTGPIALSGASTSGTATLSVFTTAAAAAPPMPTNNVRPGFRWIVSAGTAAALTMLLLSIPLIQRRRRVIVLASFIAFVGLAIAGCGSSGSSSSPGTAPGTYTVTVTGTSGNASTNTVVTVNLQ